MAVLGYSVFFCNVALNLKYRNDLKVPPRLCSILRAFYLLCHLTFLAAFEMHTIAFLPQRKERADV